MHVISSIIYLEVLSDRGYVYGEERRLRLRVALRMSPMKIKSPCDMLSGRVGAPPKEEQPSEGVVGNCFDEDSTPPWVSLGPLLSAPA